VFLFLVLLPEAAAALLRGSKSEQGLYSYFVSGVNLRSCFCARAIAVAQERSSKSKRAKVILSFVFLVLLPEAALLLLR
jgi:hypothetical protein